MKKLIPFFIFLFVFFSGLHATAPKEFTIIFKRSGVTDYYFTDEKNSETRLNRVVFSFVKQKDNGVPYSEAELGFHYQIYEPGSYNISIQFKPEGASYMLQSTGVEDIGVEDIGYDYSVYVDGSTSPSELNNGKYYLFDEYKVISKNGNLIGNVGFRLEVVPPGKELEDESISYAFMGGQYTGEIAVIVERYD